MTAPLSYVDAPTLAGSWPILPEASPLGAAVLPRTLRPRATIIGIQRETLAGYDVVGESFDIDVDADLGLTVTFTDPGPGYLTLTQVVSQINTSVIGTTGFNIAFKDNGFLKLQSGTAGEGSYLALHTAPTTGPSVFTKLGLFSEIESRGGELESTPMVDPDRQIIPPGQMLMAEGESLDARVINRLLLQAAINTDLQNGILTRKRFAQTKEASQVNPGAGFTINDTVYLGPTALPSEDALENVIVIMDSYGAQPVVDVVAERTSASALFAVDGESNEYTCTMASAPFLATDEKNPVYVYVNNVGMGTLNQRNLKVIRYWSATKVSVLNTDATGARQIPFGTFTTSVRSVTKTGVRVKGFWDSPSKNNRVEQSPDTITTGAIDRIEKNNRLITTAGGVDFTTQATVGNLVVITGHTANLPYSNNGTYRVGKIIDAKTIELVHQDYGPAFLHGSGVSLGSFTLTSDGDYYLNPFVELTHTLPAGTYRVVYMRSAPFTEITEDLAAFATSPFQYQQEVDESVHEALKRILGPSATHYTDVLYGDWRISLEGLDFRMDSEHSSSGRHTTIRPSYAGIGDAAGLSGIRLEVEEEQPSDVPLVRIYNRKDGSGTTAVLELAHTTDQTAGSGAALKFTSYNTDSDLAEFARIAGLIVDNNEGSEDGSLSFMVTVNGVESQERARLDELGLEVTGRVLSDSLLVEEQGFSATLAQIHSTSTSGAAQFDVLNLARNADKTAGSGVGVGFSFFNSVDALHEFAYIGAETEDCTSGSEDGALVFYTTTSGVERQERMRISSDGGVNTYSSIQQSSSGAWSISHVVQNLSAANFANATIGIYSDSAKMNLWACSSGTTETWGGLSLGDTVLIDTSNSTPPSKLMVGTRSAIPIYFLTNNLIRQTIAGDGEIGINTTDPLDMLHLRPITYNQNQDGGIRLSDTGDNWAFRMALKSNSSGVPRFSFDTDGVVGAFSISDGGEVSVGTLATESLFSVNKNQNGWTQALITNTNTGTQALASLAVRASSAAEMRFEAYSSGYSGTFDGEALADCMMIEDNPSYPASRMFIGTRAATKLHCFTNSAIGLTLDSSQQVGIGTVSPGYSLEVYKNANAAMQELITNPNTGTAALAALAVRASNASEIRLEAFSSGYSGTLGGEALADSVLLEDGPSYPSSRFFLGTRTAVKLHLMTNSVIKMTFDGTTDNVALGTVSPLDLLHLERSTSGSFGLRITNTEVSKTYALRLAGSGSALGSGNLVIYDHDNTASRLTVEPDGGVFFTKVKVTPEGGVAIRLTNRTGSASVKGELVEASGSFNDAFVQSAVSSDEVFGVVYEAGVANGSSCWVVVSGIAEVLLKNTTAATRGYWAKTSDTAGRADITTAAPPGLVAGHFQEIGHCIQSATAGTDVLARCVLHFN